MDADVFENWGGGLILGVTRGWKDSHGFARVARVRKRMRVRSSGGTARSDYMRGYISSRSARRGEIRVSSRAARARHVLKRGKEVALMGWDLNFVRYVTV